MAAPLGNRFWEKRAVDGREKIYPTADELWERCKSYFEFVDSNPYQYKDYVGKEGNEVLRDKPLPYTLVGLYIHIGLAATSWRRYKEEHGEDFRTVCTHVENCITNQKFMGGAIGLFNANLIARDLGLTDKTENKNTNNNTHSGQIQIIHHDTGVPLSSAESDIIQG